MSKSKPISLEECKPGTVVSYLERSFPGAKAAFGIVVAATKETLTISWAGSSEETTNYDKDEISDKNLFRHLRAANQDDYAMAVLSGELWHAI